MVFTHVVTFKWRDDDVAVAEIADALRSLVARLGGVRSYLCGPDAGLTPAAYDFAVVGTFDDRDCFTAYRDHPEHQRILSEMILPHLDARTVVQLEP
jgi:hypothetical protein